MEGSTKSSGMGRHQSGKRMQSKAGTNEILRARPGPLIDRKGRGMCTLNVGQRCIVNKIKPPYKGNNFQGSMERMAVGRKKEGKARKTDQSSKRTLLLQTWLTKQHGRKSLKKGMEGKRRFF